MPRWFGGGDDERDSGPMVPEHRTFDYRGSAISYHVFGDELDKKVASPLLLIHDYDCPAPPTLHVAASALATEGFFVIVPELPGYGDSAHTRWTDLTTLSLLLASLVENAWPKVDLKQSHRLAVSAGNTKAKGKGKGRGKGKGKGKGSVATTDSMALLAATGGTIGVMGHGTGGLVACHLAHEYPGLVGWLCLASPAGLRNGSLCERTFASVRARPAKLDAVKARWNREYWHNPNHAAVMPLHARANAEMGGYNSVSADFEGAMREFLVHARPLCSATTKRRKVLAEVGSHGRPIMIAYGENDAAFGVLDVAAWHAVMPKSALRKMRKAAHLFPLETHEQFTLSVVAFAEDHGYLGRVVGGPGSTPGRRGDVGVLPLMRNRPRAPGGSGGHGPIDRDDLNGRDPPSSAAAGAPAGRRGSVVRQAPTPGRGRVSDPGIWGVAQNFIDDATTTVEGLWNWMASTDVDSETNMNTDHPSARGAGRRKGGNDSFFDRAWESSSSSDSSSRGGSTSRYNRSPDASTRGEDSSEPAPPSVTTDTYSSGNHRARERRGRRRNNASRR